MPGQGLHNKADGENLDTVLGDFARLGLGTPVGVSALSDRNIDLVFDAIRQNVDLAKAPTELPEPKAGDGEILVKVTATTVNPTDRMMRQGIQASLMLFQDRERIFKSTCSCQDRARNYQYV